MGFYRGTKYKRNWLRTQLNGAGYYADSRFFFAAAAPFLPKAVRVDFERCEIVFFFFAADAAFLIFFFAAAVCFALAIVNPRTLNLVTKLGCDYSSGKLFGKALGSDGLIFLVGALEIRDVVIRLEVPDARRNFIDQIMIVSH